MPWKPIRVRRMFREYLAVVLDASFSWWFYPGHYRYAGGKDVVFPHRYLGAGACHAGKPRLHGKYERTMRFSSWAFEGEEERNITHSLGRRRGRRFNNHSRKLKTPARRQTGSALFVWAISLCLLSLFRMVCCNFILSETANYVFFCSFLICTTYSTLSWAIRKELSARFLVDAC